MKRHSVTFDGEIGGSYDDMFGTLSTGTGANIWDFEQINDSGFLIGFLKNNSSDRFQLNIECPHTRVRNSILADIHVHFITGSVAPEAGQTVVFDVYYIWLQPGMNVAALTGWEHSSTVTQTFAGTEGAWYYGLFDFFTNINPPENEGYGSMLLVRVTRGNGSYTGKYGILASAAHSKMNQLGSKYRASDV